MLMVREGRQLGEMRGVIVSKKENAIPVMVLVDIHVSLNSILNIDIFSEVQDGAVGEV